MTVKFISPEREICDTGIGERNLNLLAHAQAVELEIGSRCGGHGICGGDRVRIPSLSDRTGFSPLTEVERRHLTPEQVAQGWRLACQCFPDQEAPDVVVEFDVEFDKVK